LRHLYVTEIRTAAGTVLRDSIPYEGNAEIDFADEVADGATNEITVAVDVSAIVAFYIESDKDVTLHTNASPVGDQDFELAAGKALVWTTDRGDNPLTTDITSLFFVNEGDETAQIKGGFLLGV
jgi:hypothetical protein